MNQKLKIVGFLAVIAAFVVACSTEKDAFLNRTYHGVTAHYNGYFNANELIRTSMESYIDNREEDYYSLLPISPVPDEKEVVGMYPSIDTAIVKCTKVIQKHSMPNNDRPHLKKDEYNKWIDENWTMIGIASYLRRDYEGAMKSFKYVRKFYKNDPSLYVGELWMAKTNMATNKMTEAKFNLDNLDAAIAKQKEANKGFGKFKKKDKSEIPAKFPKEIRADFEMTKAEFALRSENQPEAIKFLEEALKFSNKSKEKARIHFILGQLYENGGNKTKATSHYTKVIKGNAKYSMSFNARIRRAFLAEGEEKEKDLFKMLKDAKNAEFQDQIYYALAEMKLKDGDEKKAVEYYTSSAFYSNKNTRQKGMAYEKMGDLRFDKRDYVNAQKYYDSCAKVIPENYPNAEIVKNKASSLERLVAAVETSIYEDSVQRIAKMDESAREDYLKDVIKQIEEEEKRRKEKDAERLRMLQENENLFVENGNGGKFYWNNDKNIREGKIEFKKMWGGDRVDEDDWRRSEKIPNNVVFEGDSIVDSIDVIEEDSLSVELLASRLPLTDEAMAKSNKKLLEAYYTAGMIYSEELNEEEKAIKNFKSVLDHKIENEHNVLSAFQLYKIYQKKNTTTAKVYSDYIMENYPESDYAFYLKDPDYFIKKKERDALAEQEYVTMLGRFEKGLYYPVITKADKVINDEPNNAFRAKYMLLKAYCLGMTDNDKGPLVPLLEAVIIEYPDSDESIRAKEMIDIINNGYSANIPYDFSKDETFKYSDKGKLMAIILLPEGESTNESSIKVSNFNRQYFRRMNLNVTSVAYTQKQGMLILNDFESEFEANEYIRAYKDTERYLFELRNAEIMIITQENLKTMNEKRKLEEYRKFYEEYY